MVRSPSLEPVYALTANISRSVALRPETIALVPSKVICDESTFSMYLGPR